MREITEDNYKQLEYNWGGIIIAYPRIALYFNADFYFIKQKINYNTDERTYFYSGVNQEDEVSELSPDWQKKDFESCFGNWNEIKYYQFEDIDEFCNWYVHKDDKLKESIEKFKKETDKFYNTPKDLNDKLITEKLITKEEHSKISVPPEPTINRNVNIDEILQQCEEYSNPILRHYKHGDGSENNLYSQEEIRDKINPGWNTRRARLQEVIDYIDHRERISILVHAVREGTKRIEDLNVEIACLEDWLNEVVI